jgi:uncharacterized protein (TIRG00374 family)
MLHKETVDMNRQKKKILFWMLRFLSGALILGLVLYSFNIGIGGLSSTLRSAIPCYVGLAALFFFLAILTGIMAWRILLMPHGISLPMWEIIRLYLVGFFLNNIIPGGVGGEFFKAYVVSKATGKVTQSIASILLVRYLSFLSLIILSICVTLSMWSLFDSIGLLRGLLGVIAVLVSVFVITILIFLYGAKWGSALLMKYTLGVPLVKLMRDLAHYGKYPGILGLALFLTMTAPVIEGLAYYCIALSLGQHLPFLPFLVLIPILTIIYHIPVTVNAFGTQDFALVVFMNGFGVPSSVSLPISLIAHGLKIIVAALGALSFFSILFHRGVKLPGEEELKAMAEEQQKAEAVGSAESSTIRDGGLNPPVNTAPADE